MSNPDLVQEVANISNRVMNDKLAMNGNKIYGNLAGTSKHTYAKTLLESFQDSFGTRGLKLEESWLGKNWIPRSLKDSTRLDVYDSINHKVYDYKFVKPQNVGKGLSKKQRDKILKEGPAGLKPTDIVEVNPL